MIRRNNKYIIINIEFFNKYVPTLVLIFRYLYRKSSLILKNIGKFVISKTFVKYLILFYLIFAVTVNLTNILHSLIAYNQVLCPPFITESEQIFAILMGLNLNDYNIIEIIGGLFICIIILKNIINYVINNLSDFLLYSYVILIIIANLNGITGIARYYTIKPLAEFMNNLIPVYYFFSWGYNPDYLGVILLEKIIILSLHIFALSILTYMHIRLNSFMKSHLSIMFKPINFKFMNIYSNKIRKMFRKS